MPGWRTSPAGENGNSVPYSCLKNPVNRGAWRAAVQRVAETGLSTSMRSLCMKRLTDEDL